MGRHEKPKNQKKTKCIKIYLTEGDFDLYKKAQNRLLDHSPTLSSADIFRYISTMIDDRALIQFLKLDKDCQIRVKLLNDFLMEDI